MKNEVDPTIKAISRMIFLPKSSFDLNLDYSWLTLLIIDYRIGLWECIEVPSLIGNTLIIFYKRRPIRDGRQIVEKNKRQGLAFSKKLRDSAHWGPEAVEAEFALEAI